MVSRKVLIVIVAICFILGVFLGFISKNGTVSERVYSPKTDCHIQFANS